MEAMAGCHDNNVPSLYLLLPLLAYVFCGSLDHDDWSSKRQAYTGLQKMHAKDELQVLGLYASRNGKLLCLSNSLREKCRLQLMARART